VSAARRLTHLQLTGSAMSGHCGQLVRAGSRRGEVARQSTIRQGRRLRGNKADFALGKRLPRCLAAYGFPLSLQRLELLQNAVAGAQQEGSGQHNHEMIVGRPRIDGRTGINRTTVPRSSRSPGAEPAEADGTFPRDNQRRRVSIFPRPRLFLVAGWRRRVPW
jgi:hypothetical protein